MDQQFTQQHMYSMYVNVCTTRVHKQAHLSFCALLKQVQMHFKEWCCACVSVVFMRMCPFLCRVCACELFSDPIHTSLYITIMSSYTCTFSTLIDILRWFMGSMCLINIWSFRWPWSHVSALHISDSGWLNPFMYVRI